MPRRDMKLYAKWDEEKIYYRTMTFETYSDTKFEPIKLLEGEKITVPTLTTKVETVGNVTTYYEFDNWYLDGTFNTLYTSSVMPNQDTVLYAKWNVVKVEETYQLNVYDNNEVIYSNRLKSGEQIDFQNCPKINDTTKYYVDSTYTTEFVDFNMPENDVDIHIRNLYTVTVTSQFGNTGTVTYELYQGEAISMPEQESYVIDDGNTRTTYTFSGYSESFTVMPNDFKTISAIWTVDVKHYYTVSFDLRWYLVTGCTAGSKMKTSPSPIDPIKVLEGTTIDLTQYQPTCKAYLTAIPVDAKNFKATSWGTSAWGNYTNGGSGFTTYTVTQDQTLYACWARM